MIVTIDGPAGSGKSTIAKKLAERLGFEFLDTGAAYRAVAWRCLTKGVDVRDAEAAAEVARAADVRLEGERVCVDGQEVTHAIRTPEVSEASSHVATHAAVREVLVQLQRRLAAGRNVVTEGRDQGTVVFPNAECKFFLTASVEERARRRLRDLQQAGRTEITFENVLEQIRERDQRDSQRQHSPLRPAPDAVLIDTTDLSPEEVLERLERVVRARMQSTGGS